MNAPLEWLDFEEDEMPARLQPGAVIDLADRESGAPAGRYRVTRIEGTRAYLEIVRLN